MKKFVTFSTLFFGILLCRPTFCSDNQDQDLPDFSDFLDESNTNLPNLSDLFDNPNLDLHLTFEEFLATQQMPTGSENLTTAPTSNLAAVTEQLEILARSEQQLE